MRKELEFTFPLIEAHPRLEKKTLFDPLHLQGPLTGLGYECRKVAKTDTDESGLSGSFGLTPPMSPKATASHRKEEDLPFIFSSPPHPDGLARVSASGPVGFLSARASHLPRVASRGK